MGIQGGNMKTDLPPSPPAFFPGARPKRPVGLIVSTAGLGVLLAGAVIFAITQTASLSSTRDDMAAAIAKGDKALAESEDAIAVLEEDLTATEEDLTAAEAQAVSCARAANLLAKGQTGYVRLYNRVLDLANTWRYVFDTTLYVALNKDEVRNAQINAAWNALDKCTISGGTSGIDLA
jgi:hypothetical protein